MMYNENKNKNGSSYNIFTGEPEKPRSPQYHNPIGNAGRDILNSGGMRKGASSLPPRKP